MESRKTTDLGFDQALFQAVKQNQFIVADSLIKAGANPDGYIGKDDFRCIHWAVKNRFPEMVALLLGAGADITATCKDNKVFVTPLGLASTSKTFIDWYIVKMIAKQSSDDQSKYLGHRIALVRAIYHNHRDSLRILLEAGTRVNFKCKKLHIKGEHLNSFSPLHLAVDRNDPDMIKELLKFSADPAVKNDKGQTPAEMAAALGFWSCVNVLANYDFQFTGKAIYQNLTTKSFYKADIVKWAPYKEAVFAYILQIEDKKKRISSLNAAKDKNCCLGYLFWYQRGGTVPSLETGMLKRVVDRLDVENKESVEALPSTTAKIMTVVATAPTVALTNPTPMPSAPLPSAPPIETRYYPDLTAPQLMPVYNPTLTSQLNGLPKVAELPRLPGKKREEKVERVREPGF